MQTAKQNIVHLLENTPDGATYEDIVCNIKFLQSIEKGTKDIEEGSVYSHEEALKRLKKWLK